MADTNEDRKKHGKPLLSISEYIERAISIINQWEDDKINIVERTIAKNKIRAGWGSTTHRAKKYPVGRNTMFGQLKIHDDDDD